MTKHGNLCALIEIPLGHTAKAANKPTAHRFKRQMHHSAPTRSAVYTICPGSAGGDLSPAHAQASDCQVGVQDLQLLA